jgi:RNA polymerase sigma-70 factor (ECF subfamily)
MNHVRAPSDILVEAGTVPPAVEREDAAVLEIYRTHFAFVWRTVRQLGVEASAMDDTVQDVFLVVHRKHADFEGRSSVRTWLYGIARRVVADRRKATRRKPSTPTDPSTLDRLAREDAWLRNLEAFDLVCVLLDRLDDAKREVFVLAELEGMTLGEIAEATSTNLNTVAARLRAARSAFECALVEHEENGR